MQQHGQSPMKRRLRLYFTYGVMTTTVIIISTICIFLVLGYRFDFKKGEVEQGALLQFRSFPSAATITLDGQKLSFQTPGKRNVETGRHAVTMTEEGYQPWQKNFSVRPSELRWLSYARLIPSTIDTSSVKEYSSIADALPSPDRKWIALQAAPAMTDMEIADIRDGKKPLFTSFAIPTTAYTQKAGVVSTFSLVEWDFGSRYFIVKHVLGDMTEYLRVDRTDPANTVDLSTKLGVELTDIHFSGTSGNVFYALTKDGTIRKLDINAGTLSQPLLDNVLSFRLYRDSDIAYTRQPEVGKISAGVIIDDKPSRVAVFDASSPVLIDINEYYSDYYLAIDHGNTVDIYKSPESNQRQKLVSFSTASPATWQRFSSNGRIIVVGSGTQFSSYDLETSEKFDVALPGTASDPTKPLQWLDDFYLVSTAGNEVRLSEFDGTNQHVISSGLEGQPVTLTDDGKFLFSLTRSQSGVSVQRSTLILQK
jgi:hypothetical protein